MSLKDTLPYPHPPLPSPYSIYPYKPSLNPP